MRVLKKYKVMWITEYSKKSDSASASSNSQGSSLIPRPPGEKGKNGWNLQEAMNLKDNDGLYQEMLVRLWLGSWLAAELTSCFTAHLSSCN